MALLEPKTIEIGEGLLMDIDPAEDSVRVRIGEEKVMVKKVDLWAAVFMIADAKTQEALMPVRQTEMVTYERVHHVKTNKMIPKGKTVNFKCKVNVPQVVEEGLAGNLMKKRSPIILPS